MPTLSYTRGLKNEPFFGRSSPRIGHYGEYPTPPGRSHWRVRATEENKTTTKSQVDCHQQISLFKIFWAFSWTFLNSKFTIQNFCEVWTRLLPIVDPFLPALSSLRQVVFFRRIRFLHPVGVHLIATFCFLSLDILRTWPGHRSLRLLISRDIFILSVFTVRH